MNDPKNAEIRRYDDRDVFYRGVLEIISDRIKSAISERGRCSLAFSGGRTPKRLFELLAEERDISWAAVDVFWVDERCVPSDHPDSNFRLVQKVFLSEVSIPERNIHSIATEGHSPSEAADLYEHQLKTFFEDSLPAFDIMVLGMGSDGHTASLFSGDSALHEKERWAIAVGGKQGSPPVPRVTLTLPVINNCRCCVFMVAGEEKRDVVEEIMNDKNSAAKKYPAAMIAPIGELIWNILS